MPDLPLTLKVLQLRLKRSFNLSKASAIEKPTVIARYRDGIGEGSPSIHYGHDAEHVLAVVKAGLAKLKDVDDELVLQAFVDALPDSYNIGRCALNMAFLDHFAKQRSEPLYRYLDLPHPGKVISSFTVTNGADKEIQEQLEIASAFESLKIKVGFPGDLHLIDFVLKHGTFRLRLDANGGWNLQEAIERIKSLSGYPIEFIEQPITDPTLRALDKIKSRVECTLFLDESVMNIDDVHRFAPVVDGINLKLSRCGGVLTTIRMAEAARQFGLKLLLGCMVETAVGITAALHLASLFDCFDLDAILLTEDDPYWGAHFDGQSLLLPDGNGIGIKLEDEDFV